MLKKITKYFEFEKHKTSFKTELLAGTSTFLALSYIFVVNPAILSEAGFNKSAVLFATIITSFLATFVMGIWAKKPFVLAPGMEMNSYVAFFVILTLGFSVQEALGAVFWSGILFIVLTLTNTRTKIIQAIPDKMKSGLALCVGVLLIIIALKITGVLIYDGVIFSSFGSFLSTEAYIFYFGLLIILIARYLKFIGSALLSIICASILAAYLGIAKDQETSGTSTEMFTHIWDLDFSVIFKPEMLSIILILFLVDFYGSIAKFIGLTRNTSIAKKDGSITQMKETLSVDGVATIVGSGLGTTSLTTYVESGVGIAEGGRTGLTAITCSVLMLLFLILTPLVNLVPVIATTGTLAWVGISLFPSKEEFLEYTKLDILSVGIMILTVIATFSIDRALLFGFLIYILGLILTKQYKSINKYLVLSTLLLLIGYLAS